MTQNPSILVRAGLLEKVEVGPHKLAFSKAANGCCREGVSTGRAGLESSFWAESFKPSHDAGWRTESDNVGWLKQFPVRHCHATTGGVVDVLSVDISVSALN